MKITVTVKDLITQIDEAILDYEKEYKEVMKLYQEKHKKYEEYLVKYIQDIMAGSPPVQLKSSPYAPNWIRDNFVNTLQALKAHNKELVEMDDREYTEIRSGILRLKQDTTTTIASLNAISY